MRPGTLVTLRLIDEADVPAARGVDEIALISLPPDTVALLTGNFQDPLTPGGPVHRVEVITPGHVGPVWVTARAIWPRSALEPYYA